MGAVSSPDLASALASIYEAALIAYPSSFRRDFGVEMAQVFRTACRETAQREGEGGLLRLCLHTLADLVVSAVCERIGAMRREGILLQSGTYAAAVIMGSLIGYVHLYTDAHRAVVLLLFAASCLCGTLSPRRVWRWALIIGCGVPLVLIIGHGLSHALQFGHDPDDLLRLTFVPSLIGSHVGVLMRRAEFHLRNRTLSPRGDAGK